MPTGQLRTAASARARPMPPDIPTAAPKALLFDMDGTIVDSDPIHIAVFADLMAPYGIAVDREFYNTHVIGGRNTEIFARFLPDQDPVALDLAKEAEYRRRVAQMELPPVAGLINLLDRAGALDIPCLVVTNACVANLNAVIDALAIRERFCALLSADECLQGKPHPEIYKKAVALAGFDPGDCVAFEDSASGVNSAFGAGCKVVGMTTSLSRKSLGRAGAGYYARDFNDPSLLDVLGARLMPSVV